MENVTDVIKTNGELNTENERQDITKPVANIKKSKNFFKKLLEGRKNCPDPVLLFMTCIFLFVLAFFTQFLSLVVQFRSGSKALEFLYYHSDKFFLALFAFFLINLFIYIVSYRPFVAVIITYPIVLLLTVIHTIKLDIRNEPLLATDISVWKEAASVAEGYQYPFYSAYFYAIITFVVLLLIALMLRPFKTDIKKWLITFGIGSIAIGICFNFALLDKNSILDSIYKARLFEPAVEYKNNGFFLGLVTSFKRSHMSVPKGYNSKNVLDAAARLGYDGIEPALDAINLDTAPNIIVILSESLYDPLNMSAVSYNMDPLEELRNIGAGSDAAMGKMLSGQIGGGTSNWEYEIISGKSTSFFPPSSNIYQTFVTEPQWTLASYFKDAGYNSIAVHPYLEWFWRRRDVYPLFGFDEFYDVYKMKNVSRAGPYTSDLSVMKEILYQLDSYGEAPLFTLAVTLQNHGGYSADKYKKEGYAVEVTGDSVDPKFLGYARSFSEGCKYNSEAFKYLIDNLKEVERPTYVLMFGDHGPSIINNDSLFAEGIGKYDLLRYQTPYILWSNTGEEMSDKGDLSAFMLTGALLDAAGLPRTAYLNMLLNVQEKTRGFTWVSTLDADGNEVQDDEEIKQVKKDLELVQYDVLFGKDYVSKIGA